MGVLDKILDIIQNDPQLAKTLQEGFRKILVGKVDPDSKLSLKARKDRMRVVVDQMTQPGFGDSFTNRHAYYGTLLGTAAATASVSSRGVVVEHLHLPGYHFYFPPSTSALDLVLMTRTDGNDPVYTVSMKNGKDESTFEFVAFKIPEAFAGTIKEVRDKLEAIIRDEPNDGERRVFQTWLDEAGFRPMALQGVGRSQTENRYYFLRVARINELLDFEKNAKEYEALGWTVGTVVMKLGGGAKTALAMKEGLEEALDFIL